MILGVSHLAVRSLNLDHDRQALERAGWRTAFVDENVVVHPFERPNLAPSHPDHQTLVLLRHPASPPAVELVAPVLTFDRRHATALDLSEAARGRCSGTIRSSDAAQVAQLFTEVFGFQRGAMQDEDCIEVSLKRPLPQWSISLTIVSEAAHDPMPTQDSEGWFVLALFSSDVAADAERARRSGVPAAVTEPFETTVSEQRFSIALCILKSGFAVELLQPKKEA